MAFEDLDCDQTFGVLCEESVLFSNAYTTSVLSVPALTSILTSKYPLEHGVWHNGRQYLSGTNETLPEKLVKKGVRTALFSGGPPIWRKSGLSQGFELFDDYISLSPNRLYRGAKKNIELFFEWLDENVGNSSFFSVIYFPDLQFPQVATQSNLGVVREKTYAGQLSELNESIEGLVNQLKRLNRWKDTTIILVGLNGHPKRFREREIGAYQLFSENIRIPLLIKPFQVRTDRKVTWNVDKAVNHVDTSRAIEEIFLKRHASTHVERLGESRSLLKVMNSNSTGKWLDRLLLVESGWPNWRLSGKTRFGVIAGEKLVFYQKPLLAFNMWSDRFQVSPVDVSDENFKLLYGTIEKFLSKKGFEKFQYPSREKIFKYQIGRRIWKSQSLSEDGMNELKALFLGNPNDRDIQGWLASHLLRLEDWKGLLHLGKRIKNDILIYVASENLGIPLNTLVDSCFKLLEKENLSPDEALGSFRVCNDDQFLRFLAWMRAHNLKRDAEPFLESFIRGHYYWALDEIVQAYNWGNNRVWDTSERDQLFPTRVLLAWSLPKFRKFRNIANQRLQLLTNEIE